MEIGSEKNARRILAGGVLFATIGILALVITLMSPQGESDQDQLAREVFDEDIPVETKAQVLSELSASDTSGQEISEEEKLRVLESLRVR